MKFNMKAVAASVLFAVAGTSQAAILNAFPPDRDGPHVQEAHEGELFISIFRDTASPESMIIDTNVRLLDLQSGATPTWTSTGAQTAAILSFLGTADASVFRFNAGGMTSQWDDGPNNYNGFFTTLSPTADPDAFLVGELGTPASNIQAFITQINNAYNSSSDFSTNGIVTGLNPGEAGYHYAPLWGDNLGGGVEINNENAVGTQARLMNVLNVDNTDPMLFGYEVGYNLVGFLNIDATTGVASLSQPVSQVPVPAAAWLLGSGLVGLVGVARRRSAA